MHQPAPSASMLSLAAPGSPDSVGILNSASSAAVRARQKKSKDIMNCLHDRSGTYSKAPAVKNARSSFPNYIYARSVSNTAPCTSGKPDAVAAVRELRAHPRKLALLKASSTRDLSLLLPDSATDISTASSSSSSATSNGQRSRKNCCYKSTKELETRVAALELALQRQQTHTQNLEQQITVLTNTLEELRTQQQLQQQHQEQQHQQQQQQQHPAEPAPVEKPKRAKLAAWMSLSNWFKQRPSIETLKQKNIYNNEPCFDTEIELVLRHELHKTIPKIVVDCCDIIEERYRKSDEPIAGIYRQCGDYNKMQTLRFQIDANDYEALRQPHVDIHTVAGVLKLFLREIKSPLVSANEAKTFIGKPNMWLLSTLSQRTDVLKTLIRTLPEVNRDTMKYLFAHFNRLTKVPLQHTSAESLAISLTPTIFHNVQKGIGNVQDLHVLLKESEVLADCVKIMIEYQKTIFECPSDRRKRGLSMCRLRKTLSHPDLLFQNIF